MTLVIIDQPTNLESMRSVKESGQLAKDAKRRHTFTIEIGKIADNSQDAYRNDLKTWDLYLTKTGTHTTGRDWFNNVEAWRDITDGLVEGFVAWMQRNSFAISTINRKLACVRRFCTMAAKAEVIDANELVLIQSVKLIKHKEGEGIDEKRTKANIPTRISRPQKKKAEPTKLGEDQILALKGMPANTAQGRRDALLVNLLLDHGLRAGEIAALQVKGVSLTQGTITFERAKVDKVQTHALTADTLAALRAYIDNGDCPTSGCLLRRSLKSGGLGKAGMTRESVSRRIKELGEALEIENLSSHDLRHSWATRAVKAGTDPFALKQAGGWNSMTTVSKYVDANLIANTGVKLK